MTMTIMEIPYNVYTHRPALSNDSENWAKPNCSASARWHVNNEEKYYDYTNRNGYSLKTYWLSVFIFLPVAIFIAWKKLGWTILYRIFGSLILIAVIASGTLIGLVLVVKLDGFV